MGELIVVFGGVFIAIVGAVALDLIRDQAKVSTPRIAEWLRRYAVKRLPEPLRERLDEEWTALLNETAGPLGKLWRAFGFLFSTRAISQDDLGAKLPLPIVRHPTIETPRDTHEVSSGQPLLACALDLLRISVILTDGDGHLLYANRQARHLLSEQRGLRVSMGRLSAANPKCAARLREAIQLCTHAKYAPTRPLGIAVPIPQTDAPNIAAWIHPAERSGNGEQQAAIFIRNAADLFSGDVFAATFGATQAEVRVLKLLFDGLSIAAVCAALDLSRNTVRTHVKSLFIKTGARRQAELITLAATAVAPASTLEPEAG